MPAHLVSLDGHGDIPLDRALVMVGRHGRCDVWINSLWISRLHCCLVPDLDEVQVLDMGSTNGTRINGRRIELGILRPGDELAIAHRRYQLVIHRPDRASPGARGRRLHELDTLT
jgi:pSer/pThr/pTyr-binding forkhead associated (FHA) protein